MTKSNSRLTAESRARFQKKGGLIINGIRVNREIVPIYKEVLAQYSSNTEMLEALLLEHYNRFLL